MTNADPRVLLACSAMATRFELVLHGDDPARLRAAGEQALEEIRRIEARLSFFRPTSDIGRVNAGAAAGPVPVGGETFALLRHAKELAQETNGAFDVTIAPLMRYWGFRGEPAPRGDPQELDAVRSHVGMHLVELNDADCTVRFRRPGVQIDLGAVGKGHAVDEGTRSLLEAGVENALLHGGTSSVRGIGRAPDGEEWKVAIDYPGDPRGEHHPLAIATLRDRSLSVSAGWGRTATDGTRSYGHVLDPRSGAPAEGAQLAAVVTESAMDADALSTALLTLGFNGHTVLTSRRRDLAVLVVASEQDDRIAVAHRGMHIVPDPRVAEVAL
jgi:FAD:protein FMN transferase